MSSETTLALVPFDGEGTPVFWTESGKFQHEEMGDYLIKKFRACQMGGAPAVWDTVENRYVISYDAWDLAIVKATPGTKVCNRKEVAEYLKLVAPKMDPRAHPEYIAVANGLVNPFEEGFGTRREDGSYVGFYQNTPDLPICNIIPVEWDPEAYDEVTDKWLDSYCEGDEEMRANLEEVVALVIYRGQEIQQSVWLIGEGGNGKSLFIIVLLRFVGAGNYSTVDMDDLGHKFGLADMAGKITNIGDDQLVTTISAKSCKVFKKMVVGSEIEIEQKNRPRYRIKPYCSFVYSTNNFPLLADTSDGMLDRIHAIKFNRRFRGTSDRIPNIEELLDTPQSRSYLLNLALKRLPGMVARGQFTPTDYSKRKRRQINLESDSVSLFAEERLTRDMVINTARDELYTKYKEFCESSGYGRPVEVTRFSSRMNKIFDCRTEKDGPVYKGVQMRMFREK